MRIRERFLLGISGLILVASGAKQLVHELGAGWQVPPATSHHAGAAATTVITHAWQAGGIAGEQIAFALKLLCGVALLAWCLRDIIRNRATHAR